MYETKVENEIEINSIFSTSIFITLPVHYWFDAKNIISRY